MSDVLYVGFLGLVIIFVFVITPRLDRDRIRENVEGHGGKVIEIVREWTWGNRYDRTYDVSYLTARGRRVDATCRTSMWNGVDWVNNRPPGLFSEEEPLGAPETIQCLGCGANILASQVSCPKCGWSYRAHQAGK